VGSGGGVRQSLTGWLLLVLMAVTCSGCAVASGIFKGGMTVGIFIGAIVVILIIVLLSRR
jgi:hypothetical protein